MTPPLLSACLIVKDEEKFLPGCLESLKKLEPLIDGIYVYDTGSTDATIDIAEAAGAVVQRGYWDADFSRARNEAAKMAESTWILVIDADERLVCHQPTQVARKLERLRALGAEAVQAVRVNVVDVRDSMAVAHFPSVRIFRRDSAVFDGPVHEQVVCKSGDPLKSAFFDEDLIRIKHFGYLDEAMAEKNERNVALALQLLKDAEGAGESDSRRLVRGLVDYARALTGLGRHKEAISYLSRLDGLTASPEYRSFGWEQLLELLINEGRVGEAAGVLSTIRGIGVLSEQYQEWLLVQVLTAQGDFSAALASLRRIDSLTNSVGVAHQSRVLLEARWKCAVACKEYLEAASCLLVLMGKYGVFEGGRMSLLLKLTYELSDDAVAQLVLEQGREYRPRLLSELEEAGGRGPLIAAAVRAISRDGSSFGAISHT